MKKAAEKPGTGKPIKPQPRYTGIATFFKAPYVDDPSSVDIGLVGVPFDGGVTNRPGARHGPREVRNQSTLIRKHHHPSGFAPSEACRIADLGDVWVETPYQLESAIENIGKFYERVVAAGVVPLSIGGDHSMSFPILREIGKKQPVGLVHIDAHFDTGSEVNGTTVHHGAPFGNAVEAGVLDPKRTVQIGIRGTLSRPDVGQFSFDSGMRVIFMEEYMELGRKKVIEEARRIVGTGPTYLSFDIDSLDPVYAPGTGTPEVGGLSTIEAQMLIRGLQGIDFVGGDLAEVSPPFDPSGNTAFVGAAMLFEMLCVLAHAHVKRKSLS
jgi:guanidinopropionase